MQKYETLMQHRENKKHIQSTRRFFNNYLGTMKSKIYIGSLELETQKTINDMICVSNIEIYKTELIRQNTAYNMGKLDTTKLYQEAIDELRSKIDNIMHPTMFSWDLEIDLAFNYKF